MALFINLLLHCRIRIFSEYCYVSAPLDTGNLVALSRLISQSINQSIFISGTWPIKSREDRHKIFTIDIGLCV